MPRGELHKVGGRQAREALEHGWVKIDRSTAARLFASGMPITVTGTRVHPAYLGELGTSLDPKRLGRVSFDRLCDGVLRTLAEHPALGPALAFFVSEAAWPVMPRGARDRMPSSEEPRVMPKELRGAEWLQGCDPLARQKRLAERLPERAPPRLEDRPLLPERVARARGRR